VIGWGALLAACAAVYALKLLGHLAPRRWLERPQVARLAGLVTAGLLAALVAVQALGEGRHVRADARLAGLAVAALALWRRAPFIVVIVLAAATAAGLRALGWR
jgi:branched chain amino acid efflux pump